MTRGSKQQRIIPAQRTLCLQTYASGTSIREAGERAGISYGSAQRIVEEAGIARPPGRTRVTDDERANIVGLYRSGMSWDRIARATRKGKQTIAQALDLAGVPRRNPRVTLRDDDPHQGLL